MSTDDISLFIEEMQDVAPIKGPVRANIIKKRLTTPGQAIRRAAAEEDLADPNFLALENPKSVKPFDILSWKKDGVQEGVFKKLRARKV